MRVEASVTSVSWVPAAAVQGVVRTAFDPDVVLEDDPPPDHLGPDDLEQLRATDRFRLANVLQGWIEVAAGRITSHRMGGGGLIGATTLSLGPRAATVAACALPDLRREPEVLDGAVRFVQTAGGRIGVPLPRTVAHAPFLQIAAPVAWTTLALTVHADGRVIHEVADASRFPLHRIYGSRGELIGETGLADVVSSHRHAFEAGTPWGALDSPDLAATTKSALEQQLCSALLCGAERLSTELLRPGEALACQDEDRDELFVLLDGVLSVAIDGEVVADLGPGAVLGERALRGRRRRSTSVRARTSSRIATVARSALDPAVLAELRTSHGRERSGTPRTALASDMAARSGDPEPSNQRVPRPARWPR